uniref:Putative tail protein n=1 Tax=viral metagenome TaxID=1070528 RepID=A0A6H1ZEK3_9ZZZZ
MANELEIILTLQDKVSKEFKAVTDTIKKGTGDIEKETKKLGETGEKTSKGLVKGFRDQIQPINLLLRTVTRVGFIWGVTFGLMIKGVVDLGKQIDALDKLSFKLGISASDLSKRFYGFDISTQQARTGVASMNNLLSTLGNALTYVKLKTAESIAENDILNRQYGVIGNTLSTVGKTLFGVNTSGTPGMSRESAIAAIEQENMVKRQGSKEGQALLIAEHDLYNQLTMSKVEYKRQQFQDEIALMQSYGIETENLRMAFDMKEQEDRNLSLMQMAADRAAAEGNTTTALGWEQQIQMANFKKITNDQTLISAFAANQEIILAHKVTQAKLQQFQLVAGGLSQLSGALMAYAGENKKAAKAAQAVALASTIVDTAAAVMNAMNTHPFVPVGLTMASLAAATGAVQIATISGQSFALGGRPPIGQASLVGERGPEMFVPDEVGSIIPNNKLGNTTKQISIYIEINEPTVRNDEDIDRITEQVSLRLAQEAERL